MQLFREIWDTDYFVARFFSIVEVVEGRQKFYRAIRVFDVDISIEESTRVHDDLVPSSRVARFDVCN